MVAVSPAPPPTTIKSRGWFRVAGWLAIAMVAAAACGGPETPAAALAAPHYVEEAATAGLDHRYDGEFSFFVGGGVAVFDCNGDGKADLYFAGGSEPAALFRNESPLNGELRFSEVPDAETELASVTGAYPLDIDGDGVLDLAVLRYGENVLLRGLGECHFERANEAWGFDGGNLWTTAFSATWEGSATWPTVAIGNYLDEDWTDPDRQCFDSELVRPHPTGDGFGAATSLSPGWCPLSMLFSDWDRSGRRDLRVSNDQHYYSPHGDGEEQLWRVAAQEAPRLYTGDEGWQTVRVWGMGIASHDVTGDGYPEYYLTSQGDNRLQALVDGADEPRFGDIGLERGVTAHRPYAGDTELLSTAWHDEFQDVNNDTFIDLFVAKGNVEAIPEYAARDPNNLLIGQPDGTFVEGADAAGIVTFARARGAALVDLNLDGLLDLVVVNRRDNVELWRNVGAGDRSQPAPMGNWVAIRLEEAGANRDAIGAWVEVRIGDRTARREVTVGGGHVGGQLGWIHFGLGEASDAEVRVQWPNGEEGAWAEVDANEFVIIGREEAEPRTWTPPQN
jgi:hypothetical protein